MLLGHRQPCHSEPNSYVASLVPQPGSSNVISSSTSSKAVNLRRQIGPNIATDFPLLFSFPLTLSLRPTPRFTVRRFLHSSSSNRYNIMLAPTWPSLSMFSTCPYRRSTSAFLPHPSVSRSSFFNALSHDLSYFPLDGNWMEDREKQGNSIDDVARKGYFSRPRKRHKFWPRELLS